MKIRSEKHVERHPQTSKRAKRVYAACRMDHLLLQYFIVKLISKTQYSYIHTHEKAALRHEAAAQIDSGPVAQW